VPYDSRHVTGNPQLDTIGLLHDLFKQDGIDYWLFGGWAVDFYAGRITRPHADIDLAIWRTDLNAVGELLAQEGWSRVRQPGEDGYTQYRNGAVDIDVAFLAKDEDGTVFTPLADGRADWPVGAFGHGEEELLGVRARVVGLVSLIEDKSEVRSDPSTATKDQADIAVLVDVVRDD
jgi:hypothetical protein